MFNKLVSAVEPFGFTLVILAGANLAGWVEFSNRAIVGIVLVFFGFVFILNHIAKHVVEDRKSIKK